MALADILAQLILRESDKKRDERERQNRVNAAKDLQDLRNRQEELDVAIKFNDNKRLMEKGYLPQMDDNTLMAATRRDYNAQKLSGELGATTDIANRVPQLRSEKEKGNTVTDILTNEAYQQFGGPRYTGEGQALSARNALNTQEEIGKQNIIPRQVAAQGVNYDQTVAEAQRADRERPLREYLFNSGAVNQLKEDDIARIGLNASLSNTDTLRDIALNNMQKQYAQSVFINPLTGLEQDKNLFRAGTEGITGSPNPYYTPSPAEQAAEQQQALMRSMGLGGGAVGGTNPLFQGLDKAGFQRSIPYRPTTTPITAAPMSVAPTGLPVNTPQMINQPKVDTTKLPTGISFQDFSNIMMQGKGNPKYQPNAVWRSIASDVQKASPISKGGDFLRIGSSAFEISPETAYYKALTEGDFRGMKGTDVNEFIDRMPREVREQMLLKALQQGGYR